MNIKIGEWFKIISRYVNGCKYYFVCNIKGSGFIHAYSTIEEATKKFDELELFVKELDSDLLEEE